MGEAVDIGVAVSAWNISVCGIGIDIFIDVITLLSSCLVNSPDLTILMAH
jgi:hypothetical protein